MYHTIVAYPNGRIAVAIRFQTYLRIVIATTRQDVPGSRRGFQRSDCNALVTTVKRSGNSAQDDSSLVKYDIHE